MNFKDIHIGSQLKQIVDLNNIQMERILKFFKIGVSRRNGENSTLTI